MKRVLLQTLGTALIAALLNSCAASAREGARVANGDVGANLQRAVDGIRDLGVPGVVAEVVFDGTRVVRTSGLAERGSDRPMPADAHFHIASNTKTFVATLALQLVGEGRLSLDDTVDRWLPGLVTGNGNDGRTIRVRNLLQHTSGLIDYTSDLPIRSAADWERERLHSYRPEELVAMSMQHAPAWRPQQPVETRFLYSNVDYVLTGMIIEKVTGRTWEQEARRRLIERVDLAGTVAPGESPRLPEPYAHSYIQFGPGEPLTDTTEFNPSVVGAAGAIISTTADLMKFLRSLVRGDLLRATELAAMQQTIDAPGLQDLYPGSRYGLGLMWRPLTCGGGYWSHVGEGVAGATRNGITPDARRSVVVFMSMELTTPEGRMAQEQAVASFIDRTLCGAKP